MITSHDTKHLVATALLAPLVALLLTRPAAAQPATDAQVEGSAAQSDLRWKPHRVATAAPVETAGKEPVASTTAPAATAPSGSSLPPASVGLPDGVPGDATPLAIRPRTPAPSSEYAPLRGAIAKSFTDMGEWFSTNRVSGEFTSRSAATPAAPTFAERMMRTPQGEAGRPILAREMGPGMTRQPDAQPQSRLGGGLAPRYVPGSAAQPGTPSASQRPDRLAMNNVDGLPSVMARAPQAAAIDDTAVPGRLPAADGLPAAPKAAESLPVPSAQTVDPPIIIESMPMDIQGGEGMDMGPAMGAAGMAGDGMWMGQYPAEMHVESFYDDPYACDEEGGLLPLHCCDGRLCGWMRQFGKPYYGWRWYRDFTASAGVTAFQNESNLGLLGNYGTNEYLNWAMPFWNAFGIGWQLGARGVQSNFQTVSVTDTDGNVGTFRSNARDQVFVTTGFFTRAFQGRGLQGGAVYDYLHDSYFDNIDVSQIRAEMSYVWGYHELGFWGAFNVGDQSSIFGPVTRTPGNASTLDLYTGFYRLQFGDANEWKIWGGATAQSNGIVGTLIRAPMNRSFALEGTATYVLPGPSRTFVLDPGTTVTTAPAAWNVSVNLVYYPARRSRRSLASPYRPLFDVADNGTMVRAITTQ